MTGRTLRHAIELCAHGMTCPELRETGLRVSASMRARSRTSRRALVSASRDA